MRCGLCVALLIAWLCASPCHADAPAYPSVPSPAATVGGDSQYTLGYPMGPSWSPSDERWYRRNRAIAAAGKVLTVLGISLLFVSTQTPQQLPTLLSGAAIQAVGQLVWSSAELRGANELRRRGFDVSNTAGIIALCGALALSPLTWVAGPIQSAQIRRAHGELALATNSKSASLASYGLGFRGTF